MPDIILPNLGLELPDVGSDQDTWGDILNADLTILDTAVQYDVISKTLSNVDVTLTAAEAASAVIDLSGTLLANVNVIVPATPVRLYLVRNQTSGAFTVTVKTAAGTGTPVQQGTSSLVYSDGTNIIQGATSVNGSFAVSGALSAGSATVTGALSAGSLSTASATITGGSINSTPVGNTTPSSGAFTTLSASGATTLNGAVTLGDAAADAITVTGTATFAQAAQFPDGTAALPAITNTGDTNTGRYFPAADTIADVTAGIERWRIDPAGNAGLGVTPSAWGNTYKAHQFGNGGFVFGRTNTFSQAAFGANNYHNGTNSLYIGSDFATQYIQASGGHFWFNAPSGTAGNPITFTEGMRLTSSNYFKASNTGTYGNVAGVGDQSAAANHIFQNDQSNSTVASINANTGGAVTNFDSVLATGATGKHFQGLLNAVSVFQVLANGTVQNSTGLYQSISDRRVKNNIQTLTGSGAFIDALQPRTWEWAEGSMRSGTGAGFIADEFQQVCPEAVTGDANAVDEDGKPIYQAIDPSTAEVIANLVAEIQSLRQRVAALEGVSS